MTWQLQLWIDGTRMGGVLAGAQVEHGQPLGTGQGTGEPSSCVVAVVGLDHLPPLGAQLQLVAVDGTTQLPRFTGTVYGRSTSWPRSPDEPVTVLRAQGPSARLARTYVGDEPWPAELDGERAARILQLAAEQLAGLAWEADQGTAMVLARDVDRQPAGQLLADYAASALGLLVDAPDGTVRYLDADHASGAPVALELTPAQLAADVVAAADTGQLANQVRAFYGQPDDNGRQQYVDASSAQSIDLLGLFGADLSTLLADAGAASDTALRLLARLSNPRELLTQALVDHQVAPDALPALAVGAVVVTTGMPHPLPATEALVLTGWTETWQTEDAWQADLQLASGQLFGRGLRWVDVDPELTWQQVPAWVEWDSVDQHLDPVLPAGRWVDVPAQQSWRKLDPAMSWADWRA